MRYLFLLPLLLSACTGPIDYYAASASGNVVHERRWGSIGGTRSIKRSDGSSEVQDDQRSLGDVVGGATLAVGAWQKVKVNASDNEASIYNTANLHPPQPTIVQPASVAPDTTVFPLVVPATPPSFPK